MVKKIAEKFNRLSRVHQRHRQTTDRQTTDGRLIAYSDREREFTFAKKCPVYFTDELPIIIVFFKGQLLVFCLAVLSSCGLFYLLLL